MKGSIENDALAQLERAVLGQHALVVTAVDADDRPVRLLLAVGRADNSRARFFASASMKAFGEAPNCRSRTWTSAMP